MRKNIISRQSLSFPFLLLLLALCVFVGCKDDDETVEGTLELSAPVKVVNANEGQITIDVLSNTDWKIGKVEESASWINVKKAEDGANSFTVQFEANPEITNRNTEFFIVTVDGRGFQKFQFTQLGEDPIIQLSVNELDVVSRSRTHRLDVESNIPGVLIEKEVIYGAASVDPWVIGLEVEGGVLKFKTERNLLDTDRKATIILTFKDETGEGEDISSQLEVTQMSSVNDVPPTVQNFDYARALPIGEIEENISIEGNMVVETPSENFRPGTKTYVIQDANNKAIVLEAMEDLTFDAYDKVELLLDGAEMAEVSENGFSFQIIKGISKGNVLKRTADQTFAPKEMYMKDLTDDYLLSVVTLKDVEFAIPLGGYSNFHEYYASGTPLSYSDYATKHYPAPIMDINGDHIYMITNREVSYRRKSVPKGAGSVTGIIVKIPNSAYADLGKYSIRQLKEEHINISTNTTDSFSKVLVEWDCKWDASKHVDGMQNLPPIAGQAAATLKKNDFRGYYLKNPDYTAYPNSVFFVDEYRGDKEGSTTIMNTSAMNVNTWGTGNYWIIDNISTIGITKPISLQIEANGTLPGPRDFAVQYSLDGQNWTHVANYTLISQISANIKDNVIAGYKMYMFKLPNDLLNKSKITIRLLNTSDISIDMKAVNVTGGTSRLGHISLKYNK